MIGIVVGCKSDLDSQRKVTKEKGEEFSSEDDSVSFHGMTNNQPEVINDESFQHNLTNEAGKNFRLYLHPCKE